MDLRHYDTRAHGLLASYEDVQPGLSTAHGVARTSELTLYPCGGLPDKAATAALARTGETLPLLACAPATVPGDDAAAVEKKLAEDNRFGRSLVRALKASEAAEPEQAPLAQLKAVDAAAVLIETGMAMNRGKAAEAIAREIGHYVREKR